MDQKSMFCYFRGCLLVILMFNFLQAKSKESDNPYGRMSFRKRIAHQRDMEKFGSKVMHKDDQAKMRQTLRNMGVENAEKIPFKELDNNKLVDGVVTSTGIWISPSLPKLMAVYIRHQEAKTYWEKNQKKYWEKKGDNLESLPA